MRIFKSKKIVFLFLLTSPLYAQGAHAARILRRLAVYNGLIGVPLTINADKPIGNKAQAIQRIRQEEGLIPLKQFQEKWIKEKIGEEIEIPESITFSMGKANMAEPHLNHVILSRWDVVTTMLHDPKVSKKFKDQLIDDFAKLQKDILGFSFFVDAAAFEAKQEKLLALKASTLHELQHIKDRKKVYVHHLIYLPSTALALLHTPLPFRSRAIRALATVGMKFPLVAAGTILTSRALCRHLERRADASVRYKPHLITGQVTEFEKYSQYSGESAKITHDCQRLLGNTRGQKVATYLKERPALLLPWAMLRTHPLNVQRAAYHRKWAKDS